jgi:hypothetical protein
VRQIVFNGETQLCNMSQILVGAMADLLNRFKDKLVSVISTNKIFIYGETQQCTHSHEPNLDGICPGRFIK